MIRIILRVINLLKTEKKIIYTLVSMNFIFAVLVLVEPVIYGKIIDTLINFSKQQNYELLYKNILFWVVVGLSIIVVKLFFSIISDRLGHRQLHRNYMNFFNHVLNLSFRFHSNSASGKLVKKITKGGDSIFMVGLEIFRRVLFNIFIIIILAPLMIYFNLKLGLFVVAFGFILGGIAFYLAIKTFKRQDEIEQYYTEISSLFGDAFSNISIVKSFTLINWKIKELKLISKKVLNKQYPILYFWGFLVSLSKIMSIIISIGIIIFGSFLFMKGEITVGELVMFLSFSSILISTIETLMWSLQDTFWRLSSIREYLEIIDTKIEVEDKKGAKDLKNVKGKVEFRDLTFSYDSKREVLKDINITINPGEKIAFVGHTGSGKTTMTNMLFRFYDPQKGQVLIDDVDIKDITQDSLRKNIAAVFQDSSMFNTTILENIKLDNFNATKEEIENVAIKSHSMDFINNLSNGFDTLVGERGIKLSGGEKQRLSIARAFLKDAPILVLDEATSALDSETEKYLQSSFEELMKGRTTFIIAHRLSTIRKADRIFVFKRGKIVESGTYRELKNMGGYFKKLIDSQVEGFVE
ncbi:ATP-binding cassette domain-containing protein [Candidatus Gracilibacteria bacterium]|nr:ATP-binding cassette domain-containing protein [Candidatus Gracilibacteria bacterium]